MTKIKAILYDFDGVIKDSTQIKTEAFIEMYLPFGKDIADKVAEHHIQNGGMSRFEKFKYYHQTYLNQSLNENDIQKKASIFSQLVLKKVIESNYVDGALNSIKQLKNKYTQFIVTGTPQKEIEIIVEKINLTPYFNDLFGSPKNKIQHSEHIISTYNLRPKEVVFIGDALTDYNAAKHFEFHFILRSHAENIDLFKDIDCLKINDLNNLPDIIQKIE